ncbi:MAG: hypothetical protein HY898_14305 [Deltaproteobacteria bacterium]|nr:hypothetical protein [Deltaproteobacteria bacterium]
MTRIHTPIAAFAMLAGLWMHACAGDKDIVGVGGSAHDASAAGSGGMAGTGGIAGGAGAGGLAGQAGAGGTAGASGTVSGGGGGAGGGAGTSGAAGVGGAAGSGAGGTGSSLDCSWNGTAGTASVPPCIPAENTPCDKCAVYTCDAECAKCDYEGISHAEVFSCFKLCMADAGPSTDCMKDCYHDGNTGEALAANCYLQCLTQHCAPLCAP